MKPVIVVHHHEITLKRGNRQFFERQLLRNVRRALSDILPASVVRGGYGRFVIDIEPEVSAEAVAARLKNVFGLANICVGVKVPQDVDSFCEAAERLLEKKRFGTIKVDTRRADKNFPIGSMDVNSKVGEYLCKRYGVRANLTNPDETVFIEIADRAAHVYTSKLKGPGGLPVGVSGKIAAMLSAGFDSPVASYLMMKRGATVVFVHFHSYPYVTHDSVEQVRRLVRVLTDYQFDSKLYVVPFGEAQQQIVAMTTPSLRVVLYRRMMVRITEAIALREKAQAIVTGESLGQVASQTLRNMRVINDVSRLPIFRPLVGMDKEEIIDMARKIGTHDVSKQPYDDCCSFLTPRHPETWANPLEVQEAERNLKVDLLTESCVEKATAERFSLVPQPPIRSGDKTAGRL
jgi:thiamine biosynthesis protein ThiI